MSPSATIDLLPKTEDGQLKTKSVANANHDSTTTAVVPSDKTKHVHGKEDIDPISAISQGGVRLGSIPTFPSFQQHREHILNHLAAAFRHWSREGYVLGISGHISVRDPEFPHAFWTNPLGVHFGLLKASDMVLLNYEGQVVGGNRTRPANAAGFLIHGAVHKARPDVHAACHAHTKYGKPWSVFAKPLEMLTQDTCKFFKSHSVYNSYGGVVLAEEEGDLIAQALGSGKGVILRNHGLLTVGGTVDEAAFLFDIMEVSCRDQLLADAAAAGNPALKKVIIEDEEAAYNEKMEGGPEICYAEFQAYYDYEEYMLKGEFKN